MPRLGPDDPRVARVDAALAEWRQGDASLDPGSFIHVAWGGEALTDQAAEAGEGVNVIQVTSPDGSVVLTQTCDIVRRCLDRPFVEISPLVEVEEGLAHEIERGHRPNYAVVPALRGRRLVADLDRVMTVEKSVIATWNRTPGCTTDKEARDFARALARKRVRFAFPDDFNAIMRKLLSHIDAKHDKGSADGRALRALREIRVTGSPSWEDRGVEVFLWFVRDDGDQTFEGKAWADFLDAWRRLILPGGRFTKVEGVVVPLGGMTAQEYVDSDPVDLDYLSTRGD